MDEPAAALGVKEPAQVLDMIMNIKQNLDGIIVITHKIEHIIRIADRVKVLRTGKRAGSIDTPGSLYETFNPQKAKELWDRFEFICTPKHGSWLNMTEIELNVLNGQCLNRRIDS